MQYYTNKAIITRLSKKRGQKIESPDVKTLIREYQALLFQYNELARLHGMEVEKPIDFRLSTTINDELLIASILRLRRAIKQLCDIREPEPEPEPEEIPTWYALVIEDAVPDIENRKNKGFIADMYYYQCPYNDLENKLIYAPFTAVITDSGNTRYITASTNNIKPYDKIIFKYNDGMSEDDTIVEYSIYGQISNITPFENIDDIANVSEIYDGALKYTITKNYYSSNPLVNITAYKTEKDYNELKNGVVIQQAGSENVV